MSCLLNIWSNVKQNTQFYAKSVNDNTLIESNFLSQHKFKYMPAIKKPNPAYKVKCKQLHGDAPVAAERL